MGELSRESLAGSSSQLNEMTSCMIHEVNSIYKKEREGQSLSENSDEVETSSILELTNQLKNHLAKKLKYKRRRSSIAPPIKAFETEIKTEADSCSNNAAGSRRESMRPSEQGSDNTLVQSRRESLAI